MRKNENSNSRTLKIKKNIDFVYFHPFVISVFPLFFFINYNKDQLVFNWQDTISIIILIILFTFIVYSLNLILFKNLSKTAVTSFTLVSVFFCFGYIESLIDKLIPNLNIKISLSTPSPVKDYLYIDIGTTKILYIVFALILLVSYLKVKKTSEIPLYINKTLMIFSVMLVLYNVLSLLIYHLSLGPVKKTTQVLKEKEDAIVYPDIYYIIPDSYARADVLKEVYGYDNFRFIDFLKSKRFYVTEKSNSNYAHTFLSLASSLNLDYINHLTSEIEKDSQNISKPLSMLSDNMLAKYLKNKGYVFVNFSSDGGITGKIEAANYNMQDNSLLKFGSFNLKANEFFIEYLKTTAVYPLYRFKLIEFQRSQVLYVFDNLYKIDHIDKPRFILAHIIIPHPPYIFNKDGGLPEKVGEVNQDIAIEKKLYTEQLEYTNIKLQESVDKILFKDKNTLIIIQADHGPSITLGNSFEKNLIPEENIDGVMERMAIFNAYYFPDKDYSMLYENISPVNTFRIILNKYFGEDLELLENKVYISDYSKLYEFWDVTDLVK